MEAELPLPDAKNGSGISGCGRHRQALRDGFGARRCQLCAASGTHPHSDRRERRREGDAVQDHVRPGAAERGRVEARRSADHAGLVLRTTTADGRARRRRDEVRRTASDRGPREGSALGLSSTREPAGAGRRNPRPFSILARNSTQLPADSADAWPEVAAFAWRSSGRNARSSIPCPRRSRVFRNRARPRPGTAAPFGEMSAATRNWGGQR